MALTLRSTVFAAALALSAPMIAATPALAGPQFIDSSGFAVSGYDVVAYRGLDQSSVGDAQPEAVLGSVDHTTEWNGAQWAFSSAENLAAFQENPEFYAPAFDGHCAYGAAQGGKVPANPHLWRIVDDVLYLNITQNVVGFWEADIPGNISTAEKKWPGIEGKTAGRTAIPNFTSPGPLGQGS